MNCHYRHSGLGASAEISCRAPLVPASHSRMIRPESCESVGVSMRAMAKRGWCGVVLLLGVLFSVRAADPAETRFFEKKIRPVLVEHCYECHSAEAKKLTRRPAARHRERRCSRAATPARPSCPASRTRACSSRRCGTTRSADAAEGEAARRRSSPTSSTGSRMGAPDPRDGKAATVASRRSTSRRAASSGRSSRRSDTPCPHVKDAAWPRSDIDRFILAGAGSEGPASRSPTPTARTLIRRVDVRPDRPAADAGGDRRVRRRRLAPTPSRRSSIGCWRRRTSASAGAGTGSTSPATPTPTARTRTSPSTTPGATATTSSTRSTRQAVRPVRRRADRRRPAARRRRRPSATSS